MFETCIAFIQTMYIFVAMIVNIDLPKETLKKYQLLADNECRSRKSYIEQKLIWDVKSMVISKNYKPKKKSK